MVEIPHKFRLILLGSFTLVAGFGCATVAPSAELAEARVEYQKASQDQTQSLNPAGLYEAKKYLDTANKAFEKEPRSDYSRDMGYIALRKVELAEVQARTVAANQQAALATQEKEKMTQTELASSRAKLSQYNQQLGQTHLQLQASNDQLQQTTDQLAAEKQARLDAERRAEEAVQSLSQIASVKRESRGLVITLSGSVLFASGRSTLLSDARPKLDEVATVLQKSDAPKFVVEGYTDSRGSEDLNQELSLRRAQTVRDYLVEHGVPAEKIAATGYGPSRPVADNRSAEGRANNRRVEIVLGSANLPAATGGSGQ